jgi:aminoglycoside 3-N-acetyltransferase
VSEAEARAALRELLGKLGVTFGSTIFLGIDMGRLPLPRYVAELTREAIRQREQRWCGFVLSVLREVLGPDGTLIVPTFSYGCANPRNAFILEQTPSNVGAFTEYVRCQPEARRSLHPIFSVAALGRHASAIVDNVGGSAFGPLSPFGRLGQFGARFASIGVPFHLSVTYLHHLEQCYGCTHRYHKLLTTPVFADGQRVNRQFMAYMRFLGVDVEADFRRAERRLLDSGSLIEVPWGQSVSHAVAIEDVDRIGYTMLVEDSFAFASRRVCVELDGSSVTTPVTTDTVVFQFLP